MEDMSPAVHSITIIPPFGLPGHCHREQHGGETSDKRKYDMTTYITKERVSKLIRDAPTTMVSSPSSRPQWATARPAFPPEDDTSLEAPEALAAARVEQVFARSCGGT